MKIRWHDKDLWASMEFRGLEGWAKLLYYYMYDIADLAGIVELDITLAEVFIKTKLPDNIDEIEEELEPFFVRVGSNLFLIKYFVETTQGGSLILHNPPHVKVLKDMVQRHKKGLTNVVSDIRKWNPELGVQTIQDAQNEVNQMIREAGTNLNIGSPPASPLSTFRSISYELFKSFHQFLLPLLIPPVLLLDCRIQSLLHLYHFQF